MKEISQISREYVDGYEECLNNIIEILKRCKTFEDFVTYSYLMKGDVWAMKLQLEQFEATVPNIQDEQACSEEEADELVINLGDGRNLVISIEEAE